MLLNIVQFEKLMIIKLKSDLYLCCGPPSLKEVHGASLRGFPVALICISY